MKDNYLWKRVYLMSEAFNMKKGRMLDLRPNALSGVWIALMDDGEILNQEYASSYRRAKVIMNKLLN